MVTVRRGTPDEYATLADFAVPLQQRPERHVIYLGLDAPTILADLHDDSGRTVIAVAERDRELVGWLVGDADDELGRVWWLGPFIADGVDWDAVAGALYDLARADLPAAISTEEFAPDREFAELGRFALARGFSEETASALLSTGLPLARVDPPRGLTIAEIASGQRTAVSALHDRLFPGTHTPGHRLVESDERHVRLAATRQDGSVVGYVAAEAQADGAAYIDFLGVEPAERGHGLGAALVVAATERLPGCPMAHLTVRADNRSALALYRRLGFSEDRVTVPYRLGFTGGSTAG